jgi:hypothetical protein
VCSEPAEHRHGTRMVVVAGVVFVLAIGGVLRRLALTS